MEKNFEPTTETDTATDRNKNVDIEDNEAVTEQVIIKMEMNNEFEDENTTSTLDDAQEGKKLSFLFKYYI